VAAANNCTWCAYFLRRERRKSREGKKTRLLGGLKACMSECEEGQ